ncbi:MAG: hypothetical protein F7C38_05590 [Desulfurococcales archaeon]|nr:hypothetical protein [Desulfurococcales archaeon]
MAEEERRPESVSEDVEEVRGILTAVSDFLKEVQKPIKDLLETLLEPVRGDKFGSEIAAFYKSLVESGIPEDLAREMTKEYFEKRTKILDAMSSITNLFKGGKPPFMEALKHGKGKSGGEEEEKDEDEEEETKE